MNIRTERVMGPYIVGNTRHDGAWTAVDDDTYDGPGSLLGQGDTEQEAIEDLMGKMEMAWRVVR